MILYEYPFNERIRTYLRLEELFRRLGDLVPRPQPLDHHFALVTLFEIMEVATRADLKADVLKDLERYRQALETYRGNPGIAERVLDGFMAQVDRCRAQLNQQPGKVGAPLAESEFLMALRSRIAIPGGTCGFDLPGYRAWQHRSAESRGADVSAWAGAFAPLAESIYLLLRLLRDAGMPHKVMSSGGQLQQSLNASRAFQLLRLRIDPALALVPEISGNRLLVSVRLMHQLPDGRLEAASDDVECELTLCA